MNNLHESFCLCVQSCQNDTVIKIPENKNEKFCILLIGLQVFHVVLNRVQSKHVLGGDYILSILLRCGFRLDFCTVTCIETCCPQGGGKDFYWKQACLPEAFRGAAQAGAKIPASDP